MQVKPWYTRSNWTGRTPRTLGEAFGPYHSSTYDFYQEVPFMSFKSMIAYIVVLALVLLLAHFVAGYACSFVPFMKG